MGSIVVPSVPYYRNSQFKPALAALVEYLMGRDYSSHAVGRIFDFVACNGTLEGSLVEGEDMADAERVFVDNLPPIDFDDPVWSKGDDDDGPDVGYGEASDEHWHHPHAIPPISGGGWDGPTQSDWDDYRRWCAELDAREEFRRLEEKCLPEHGYE